VVTRINIYILSIFLKVQNFMITLTVISTPSVLSTRKFYLWSRRSTKMT